MNQVGFFSATNKYLRPGNNLSGCVNDSKNLRTKAQAMLQMSDGSCAVQWDQDNTLAGMEEGFDILLREINKLDYVLWTHSGHGGQRPSASTIEPDGVEGTIICYDTDLVDGQWVRSLTESLLFQKLIRVPQTTLLEAIIDVCFAGEAAEKRTVRGLQGPSLGHPNPILYRTAEARGWDNIVIWAASQPTQESAEDLIDGQAQGAFTWALCKEWVEGISRGQLLENVRDLLKREGYDQSPMLLCNQRLLNLPVGVK